jgi:hypothetical protein
MGPRAIQDKPIAPVPIEAMILKEGLRIKDVLPCGDIDLLAIILNSGDVLQACLSDFERLKKASDAQLKKWRLIGGGMGGHWEGMDEDLSLRGFIRDRVQQETLWRMTGRMPGMTIKSRRV